MGWSVLFPERVNKLFEALGATSTEIARFAGCDRSLVSRLKNGGRIPKPSSVSTAKLINGIFLFADDKNLTKKLAEAVFCKSEPPSPGEIKNRILEYLYEGYKNNERFIADLLEAMSDFLTKVDYKFDEEFLSKVKDIIKEKTYTKVSDFSSNENE